MEKYTPPFSITSKIVDMISSIDGKIRQLDNNLEKEEMFQKNNLIHSIHSSLAIEANSLSFSQVKDVINGKNVIASTNEIQEVKNAYEAYLHISNVNPYSIRDLKSIHGVMTKSLVKESGKFRSGEEGVFDEDGNCIHICPPPEQVDGLMKQLFKWMKVNKNKIHPFILSSVFHYEFVFIHPFCDGNGRMARLWQDVILSNFENLFMYLSIESMIRKHQNDYYFAISQSNIKGESTCFVEFMIKMIDKALDEFNKNNAVE